MSLEAAKALFRRTKHAVERRIYAPSVEVVPTERIIRLGSAYGGWSFVDLPSLHCSTIISAGLGEDATFDIGFAARFNAKVIMVDPTPRAIAHYRKLLSRIGCSAERPISTNGNQPVEAYDLSNVVKENFELIERALWTSETSVDFFEPPNPAHVSHSITNFQNGFSARTPSITVLTTTISHVLEGAGLSEIPLIKLDIEGAEVPVLKGMLRERIFPEQILVEVDELSIPSAKSQEVFREMDDQLHHYGYDCVYWDCRSNFAYLRRGVA